MAEHTPAPWALVADDGIHIIHMSDATREGSHWEPQHRIEWDHGLYDDEEQYAEADATARLIAAAPDLLAALKRLVDVDMGLRFQVTGYRQAYGIMAVQQAKDAIAKAEGQS